METLFTGKNIIRLKSVDSTNNYTSELLRQSVIPEGTVIVAEEQKQGRGQRGNNWESEPGKNLTFSLVYYPSFLAPEKQFDLTKAISVGILKSLEKIGLRQVSIKWPNDIYVGEKKIAGILIENTITSNKIKHCVIGVGLNINQTDFNGLNATSVRIENGGAEVEIEDVFKVVLSNIEANYFSLKNSPGKLAIDYGSNLFRLDESTLFIVEGKEVEGTISGVSEIGKLLVETNGKTRAFGFKEIGFVSTSSSADTFAARANPETNPKFWEGE